MKTTAKALNRSIDRMQHALDNFEGYVEIDPEGSAARVSEVAADLSTLVSAGYRATVGEHGPRIARRLLDRAAVVLADVPGQQKAAAEYRQRLRAVSASRPRTAMAANVEAQGWYHG